MLSYGDSHLLKLLNSLHVEWLEIREDVWVWILIVVDVYFLILSIIPGFPLTKVLYFCIILHPILVKPKTIHQINLELRSLSLAIVADIIVNWDDFKTLGASPLLLVHVSTIEGVINIFDDVLVDLYRLFDVWKSFVNLSHALLEVRK